MGRKRCFSNRKKLISRNKQKQHETSLIKLAIPVPKVKVASAQFRVTIPLSKIDAAHITFAFIEKELKMTTLPLGWTITSHHDKQQKNPLVFCYIEHIKDKPLISYTLKILPTLSYTLSAFNRPVTLPTSVHINISNTTSILHLLNTITNMKVCPGISQPSYFALAETKGGKLVNREGQIIAILDEHPFNTIHHINCSMLQVKATRCSACSSYIPNLKAMAKKDREKKSNDCPASTTNHRYITIADYRSCVASLRSSIQEKNQKIIYLEKIISEKTTQQAITVNNTTHQDLFTIMQQHHNDIVQLYPEDSFQYIFWKSQYDSAQKKSKNGYRWNPAMIRWCIYLHHKSSKAYELLRKSNCINLPSQRTLRDYTYLVDSSSGFTDDLDSQLLQDSKLTSLKEHEKYVGLIGDEMHVKQGLIYDKNTGDLIGYCNLGDINNHLTQLEQHYCNDASQGTNLATTVMVLMIRGLFNSFTFPYASFPTSNLSGEQLVPIFYEAIMRIERCGLKVLSITLDGNSVNRKFIKIVGNQDSPVKHKFCNPLTNNAREVYLISDPPHLLKTARNCLSSPNRQMQFNGKPITWKYIKQLYEIATKTTGVTTLPKLKYEHVHLNSFSKMRVDLAAETLSQTVATAVRMHFKEEASETANFLEMMDKFFDLLNVTNYTKCYTKLKYFQTPYRWTNDFRIQWLKSEFLVWLEKWEIETKSHHKMKSSERKKLMLSDETLLGLRITAYSFIDLINFIFTIPGVRSFLSEHISQDPLEKYFGRQRQSGGVNENPTTKEFLKNNDILRVVNSINIETHKGNVRGARSNEFTYVATEPLQKRQRMETNETTVLKVTPQRNPNLLSTLCKALEDKGFDLPSPEAAIAKHTATEMMKWMTLAKNETAIQPFEQYLSDLFHLWIDNNKPISSSIREQIWLRFSQFTSSTDYTTFWSCLYSTTGVSCSPILSFYITYHYFTDLWKYAYPTFNTHKANETSHLTYDEENALWYIAGYVIRKVKSQLHTSTLYDSFTTVLDSFIEESGNDDDEGDTVAECLASVSTADTWINSINRGGLIKCNNEFYQFVRAIELEMKALLQVPQTHSQCHIGNPKDFATKLSTKFNIMELWRSILPTEATQEPTEGLLLHLLTVYSTVRVHAFATKLVEDCKKKEKENLQKSKSLRKKLLQ